MKIELKKISISLSLSEETIAFTADIYVNGVKAGYARNGGTGGSTHSTPYEGMFTTLQAAEKFLATQSKEETFDGYLNDFIDIIIDGEVKKKESAKLAKQFEKGIVYGNESEYRIVSWKLSIAELLKHPQGLDILTKKVNALRLAGETILNTNLPAGL